MGYSETDSSSCRRHPNHRQSPGVCSSCLREKLSKLNTYSPSFNPKKSYIISDTPSLSSTPPYSDTSSTTTTNTTTATTIGTCKKSPGSSRHRRNGSETYVSVGLVLNNGLKKSRSVSCGPLASSRSNKLGANDVINEKFKSCINVCGEVDKEGKKKNNGFLKKLIHSTSKKTKGVLMHSKTMKERSHPSTYNNINSATNNKKN